MKFGKLADISTVDFSLRADPTINQSILRQRGAKDKAPLHIYMGATGWSMPQWKGKWYPAKAKTADFLGHYSKQFNCIELNTTHYRIPNEQMVEKWYQQSKADFRFCPKVPQVISHKGNLGLGEGSIPAFCNAIEGLKEKLGACFIQLPPYFGVDRMAILERFLQAWPRHIQLAIELRHESWFVNTEEINNWLSMFEKYGKHTVITDVAGRRDVLHMGLSSATTMVRFVGNGMVKSDFDRASHWIDRWQIWHQLGLRELYLFPHQPDNILAPDMSAHFYQKLADLSWVDTRGPAMILEQENGGQMQLF